MHEKGYANIPLTELEVSEKKISILSMSSITYQSSVQFGFSLRIFILFYRIKTS